MKLFQIQERYNLWVKKGYFVINTLNSCIRCTCTYFYDIANYVLFMKFYILHNREAHRQGLIYGVAFAFSEGVLFLMYAISFRYGAYLIEIDIMSAASVYRYIFRAYICSFYATLFYAGYFLPLHFVLYPWVKQLAGFQTIAKQNLQQD